MVALSLSCVLFHCHAAFMLAHGKCYEVDRANQPKVWVWTSVRSMGSVPSRTWKQSPPEAEASTNYLLPRLVVLHFKANPGNRDIFGRRKIRHPCNCNVCKTSRRHRPVIVEHWRFSGDMAPAPLHLWYNAWSLYGEHYITLHRNYLKSPMVKNC